MERSKSAAKPFDINKRLLVQAWEKVRANDGAPGVDMVEVGEYAAAWQDNLYKLWNRMSSGSYMPAPVRGVEIPKADGGQRLLGVPTINDRVAQTAVALVVEERVDPIFHPDSYGYRRKRSAHNALATTRARCFKYDWVIDLDIRAFFDSVAHDLLMRAVEHHVTERWMLLCIQRWLVAPMLMPDGTTQQRTRGTPQGSPISPVLANLFMHYAFDKWMDRNFAGCPFERYADDVVVHCTTQRQAEHVLRKITARMAQLGLEVHPDKTRIVYCKDGRRRGDSSHTSFDFLGFRFAQRQVNGPTGYFSGFTPAISPAAVKRINATVRSWQLQRRTRHGLSDLAQLVNPVVRGWINYYGAYTRSALHSLARHLDRRLVAWAMRKYKRFRRRRERAERYIANVRKWEPTLFAHWQLATL